MFSDETYFNCVPHLIPPTHPPQPLPVFNKDLGFVLSQRKENQPRVPVACHCFGVGLVHTGKSAFAVEN